MSVSRAPDSPAGTSATAEITTDYPQREEDILNLIPTDGSLVPPRLTVGL